MCSIRMLSPVIVGWHHLSKTTSLIRPHLSYAWSAVSTILIVCSIRKPLGAVSPLPCARYQLKHVMRYWVFHGSNT